jgi:uncharacterized surface protein with fasciclin (FAS1) repeats
MLNSKLSTKKLVASVLLGTLLVSFGVWACDGCGCSTEASHEKSAKHDKDQCDAHDHDHDIVSTAISAGNFKTLTAAIKAAELVKPLKGKGPFTVFAPTDEAFSKLPKGTLETLLKPKNRSLLTSILTYHVVPGNVKAAQVVKLKNAKTLNGQQVNVSVSKKGVKIDNAKVIKTDITTSNGTIHVIDRVILPVSDDVVALAAKSESFKTLVAAVKAAGLVDALKQKGPFTIFAPDDKAFSNLPKGTVESLLKPENLEKLQAILKYHVVPGRFFASDVLSSKKLKTLQGIPLQIKASSSGVLVNNASVTKANIDAKNGVIHVIDRVLLPNLQKDRIMSSVRDQIMQTINRGSHLYNSGHHKACADLYMKTAQEVMQSAQGYMCQSTMKDLETAISKSRKTHSSNSRAWTMRHALDSVLAAIID